MQGNIPEILSRLRSLNLQTYSTVVTWEDIDTLISLDTNPTKLLPLISSDLDTLSKVVFLKDTEKVRHIRYLIMCIEEAARLYK